MQWKSVMFGSMERERERPGTNHNTIKGKVKQCRDGSLVQSFDGVGDEKNIFTQEKNCRRNKGNVNAKKTTTTPCRLKIPHPRHNFSKASPLKTSASDDG